MKKKVAKKKVKPVNLGSELEAQFKNLWDEIAAERFPNDTELLQLRSQVPLTEIVAFKSCEGQHSPKQTVDFVCDWYLLTIEIQGGTSKGTRGAHTSYQGVKRDYYKQLMLGLGGWVHIELDNRMCKDKELICSIINSRVDNFGVVQNPTNFESWGNNKALSNKQSRFEHKLIEYLKDKQVVGTSTQLAASLKISVRAIRPIMLEQGWKQKTINGKQIWMIK